MKLFFLVFTFLFLWGCRGEAEREDYLPLSLSPDKAIEGVVLTERAGNFKKWVLNASSAELIKGSGGEVIKVNNYEMDFFEDDSEVSQLRGARGEYDRSTEIFDAFGRVEIDSQERKIITSDVRWHPEEEIFTSDTEVEIQTEHGIIRGIGMVASKDLDEIDIKEKISGELRYIEGD